MRASSVYIMLLAAGTAQHVSAHTAFTNFFVDGVNQGDGVAVRMSDKMSQATFPIPSVASPDMACGVNGEAGVARVAASNAGSTLTFEWRDWPDGTKPGSIDISHKGPCAVYMKKVEDSAASDNAAGEGWFKIMEDGYDSQTGKWCTEKLIPNNGHMAATIPKDLSGGYYLVRPELLALHEADKTPPNPQFYVGCAQIFIASTGSAAPADTVSIPGYVSMSTPAMTYNIWKVPLSLPFPTFGPSVYMSGNSKRALSARAPMSQTIGLKPDSCVMTNANWCGFLPPAYTDQESCWTSSKNCSAQTTSCYESAGPTGSKNCHNWEKYCTKLRQDCPSGPYKNPPSISNFMPAPLAKLDMSKVVVANQPMQSSGLSSPQPSKSGTTPEVSSTTIAVPASSSTLSAGADNSMANGSINTCGSNGGQNCKTGMCCSSHGYCGTSDEYCGTGCQSMFGKCSGSSNISRSNGGRRGHVLRGLRF